MFGVTMVIVSCRPPKQRRGLAIKRKDQKFVTTEHRNQIVFRNWRILGGRSRTIQKILKQKRRQAQEQNHFAVIYKCYR